MASSQPTLDLAPGTCLSQVFTVQPQHLALNWQSGAVAVLATPQMIAWMEGVAADLAAPLLDDGLCTVGTLVNVKHSAAVALGAQVTVEAEFIGRHERLLEFRVRASDPSGEIGSGTHQRVIVSIERLNARAVARTRR